MKKALKKESKLYHYANGKKVVGPNPDMWGDCTGLQGDCTGLFGSCSGLRGYCSRLFGDCTGLWGDLDSCDLSLEERAAGIYIKDLVLEEPKND